MLEPTLSTCPNCHLSDKVENVSKIVAEGFSTNPVEGAEPFEWAGQVYYIRYKEREPSGELPTRIEDGKRVIKTYNWNSGSRQRITVSPLANRLLPQIEPPDLPPNFSQGFGCWYLISWPARFIVKRFTKRLYSAIEASYKQKLNNLAEAQAKWSRLFYCYRCEGVFTEQTEFIPIYRFNNYLFDLNSDH